VTIRITKGNLEDEETFAIVSEETPELNSNQGVALAIKQKGGR
jgi:O-acetyl-ADP-ribose deacetylase (regulator of RNase III)